MISRTKANRVLPVMAGSVRKTKREFSKFSRAADLHAASPSRNKAHTEKNAGTPIRKKTFIIELPSRRRAYTLQETRKPRQAKSTGSR